MRSSRLTSLLLAAAIAPALALPQLHPDPTHTYVYFGSRASGLFHPARPL